MKKILWFSFLLILVFSCNRTYEHQSGQERNYDTNLEAQDLSRSRQIETIREFYLTFYGADLIAIDDEIASKYVSERILNRMDSLRSDGNLILDYDPFIQGQDWDSEQLIETLEIKPLKNENEFRVSFYLFGKQNGDRSNIDLSLRNYGENEYKIFSILNDDYLNFSNDTSK